jgi:hypothetical protein
MSGTLAEAFKNPELKPQVPHAGGIHGNIIFIPTSSQRTYSRKKVKNHNKTGKLNLHSKTLF